MGIGELTVKERIILHLFDFNRHVDEYEAPLDVTQTGIAESVEIRVHHVSQYVRPLILEELIEEGIRHIQGQARSRKVYFLTPTGRHRVASLRTAVFDHEVPFRRANGEVVRFPLNRIYQQERRGTRLIELLQELGASGAIAETPATIEADVVDRSQEAPPVEKFYGRTKELERAIRSVGQIPVIVVSGMAGIGKTAFGAEVCREFRGRRSLLWRRVRPWDTSRSLGLQLAALMSQARRPGLHRYLTAGEAKEFTRIEEILSVDLQGLRSLLVFDDVHVASADATVFLELLYGVLRFQKGSSVLLLTREIPGFYSRRQVEVEAEVLEIPLTPLDSETARAILGDEGVNEARSEKLIEFAGGSPLFLKLLAKSGTLPGAEGSWSALDSYIAEEIQPSLEREEAVCLHVASLYELPVRPQGLLLEGRGDLRTVLELRRRGLLEGTERGTVLLHDSLRDYFHRGLPRERREALVSKVVLWLTREAEKAEGKRMVEEAVGLMENAVRVEVEPQRRTVSLERLGRTRRSSGDFLGALDTFRAAWRGVTEDADRVRLHRQIAGCLFAMRQLEETEEEIERGLLLAPSGPSLDSAHLLAIRANLAFVRGEHQATRSDLDTVMSWESELSEDVELAIWVSQLDVLARSWFPKLREVGEMREDWRRVHEFARASTDRPFWLWVSLDGLALGAMETGETEKGLRHLEHLVELGEASGRAEFHALGLLVQGWSMLQYVGDNDRAEALLERALSMFQEMPSATWRVPWCYRHFSDLYWRQGRFDEARESLEHFLRITPLPPDGRVENLSRMVRLCIASGHADAATTYLEQATRLDDGSLRAETSHFLEWAKAAVHADRGEVAEAESHFTQALSVEPPIRTCMPGNLIMDLASTHHPGDLYLDFGRFLLAEKRPGKAKGMLLRAQAEFKKRNRLPRVSETQELLDSVKAPAAPRDPDLASQIAKDKRGAI